MKARILDKSALEAISPTALRAYLEYEGGHVLSLSAGLAKSMDQQKTRRTKSSSSRFLRRLRITLQRSPARYVLLPTTKIEMNSRSTRT
jgi:hypothetical protein